MNTHLMLTHSAVSYAIALLPLSPSPLKELPGPMLGSE